MEEALGGGRPLEPCKALLDPGGVTVLVLLPVFFHSEPRSGLRWMLLPGEAGLLPQGPESIPGARRSSEGFKPSQKAASLTPQDALWWVS